MQGQYIGVRIQRQVQLDDDVAGGAQRGDYVDVDETARPRARIMGRRATLEMRAQGLTADLFYDAHITPATTDVRRDDRLVPRDGDHEDVYFLVTGVQESSLPLSSPRAHLVLQLERRDTGKVIDAG